MPTQKQLAKLLRLIERDNGCKVIGFAHDDMEPFYTLDVFMNVPNFVVANYLFGIHFFRVDFVNRTMQFIIFEDELPGIMKTVDLVIEYDVPSQLPN